jgi:2-polyprenyl-3-methyl-5-hydroxy-6-metoxy-1,4-benzoquinol methylase
MVSGSMRRRAIHLREYMDDPACGREMLDRTYERFAIVNRFVSGWRGTYLRRIRPLLSAQWPATLLDIGSGGGDIALALAKWAADDGLQLSVTAIDPDERAHAFALGRPNPHDVRFRQAGSSELVDAAERYDFVVSNHVLHHLDAAELDDLLLDSELLCRGLALHSDIRRSPLAYAAFSVLSLPLSRGSFIRDDGLTSIRRSFTTAELRVAATRGWAVEPQRPYRNLLTFTARTMPQTPPQPIPMPPLPESQPPGAQPPGAQPPGAQPPGSQPPGSPTDA